MIFFAKNDLGSSEEDRKRERRTTMERKVGVKEERFLLLGSSKYSMEILF